MQSAVCRMCKVWGRRWTLCVAACAGLLLAAADRLAGQDLPPSGAMSPGVVQVAYPVTDAALLPEARAFMMPPNFAVTQETPRLGAAEPVENVPAPRPLVAGITLDQAISGTLCADPKIRAGFEAIRQANADWLTSSLPPNPTLVADGVFLPLRSITPANPGGPPQSDVMLSYPIDWFLFGKRAAAMASAQLGVRQSEADYADLIRQRVATTSTAFYDVVEAKALLILAQQDVDSLARLEAATRRAVEAGGRPLVELHRARLDLLQAQTELRQAASTLVVNKAKLRAQFGCTNADPAFDVDGNLEAPLSVEPLSVEAAMEVAQENRPDIQSLRFQVCKAQADVEVAQRNAYPQITPQFGYTRQFQVPIGDQDFDAWNAQLTASVPLFDRNQGNRAKAQSVAAQNGYNLQAGIVDLRAEIVQSVQTLTTALEKARSVAGEQVQLAAEVRESITKAYHAGGRPLIDVLDAERTYRDTYRLYINSRADYWRAVHTYQAAIGKQMTP